MTASTDLARSRIEIAAGARATEARLLSIVAAHRERVRADPALLARPLRILVPSGSLRLHVGERIASEIGAVAGVALQTLHGAAIEILDRCGASNRGADALVDLWTRRWAREERALREAFEPFRDGYRAVSGSVRDLLDAGFEAPLGEAALERLGELKLPLAQRGRAEAVVRTAGRVAAELESRGVGGRSDLLRRAREAFDSDAELALPAHELVVHGFADATGRATDLLESLTRRIPTFFLIDHPPDPDEPSRTDLGAIYSDRLLERIQGVAGEPHRLPSRSSESDLGPTAAHPLALFRAPGPSPEAREVARRVREALLAGVRPERVAIVARDLSPYRSALRTHLARLGVPCSALRGRAPLDGEGRRIVALAELLEARDGAPADRWLDAVRRIEVEQEGERALRAPSARLRLGLRVVGAARLADVAGLNPDEHLEPDGRLRLPVRTSLRSASQSTRAAETSGSDPDRSETSPPEPQADPRRRFHATQSRLSGEELRAAVRAAAALSRRLERWPAQTTAAEHAKQLEKLRRKDLGWTAADRIEKRVAPIVERIVESLGDESLSAEEFRLVLRRDLEDAAAPPLGGNGAGVQVLDAMEARGRTFEQLFVVGMNRDIFPRVASDDALLSDDLRRALRDLVPDIPIKGRARDEDRYLFAQLASAAEQVTLSWQMADDDGKPRVISPLVERLLREESESSVAAAAPLYPADPNSASAGPRTAHEHAILAALAERREGLHARLPAALEELGLGAPRAQVVAGVREAVLAAWDEGPFDPRRLAPFLGFLGPQSETDARPDPAQEAPYVTRLEALSTCAWQMILSKFLRLEEAPDPLDGLPAIEARTVGIVAHEVLQRVAERGLGELNGDASLADVLRREPVALPWPKEDALDELLHDIVRERVRRERAPLPGLVQSIAAAVRPRLERARDFLEDERARFSGGVLGVEVEGRAQFELEDEGALEVVFRADRIELQGERYVLTDYKTGKAKSSAKADFLSKGLPRGRQLQPIAYALAGAGNGKAGLGAHGRYLFLGGDEPQSPAVPIGLPESYADLLPDVQAALGTLVGAWRTGVFFPRVVEGNDDKQPEACRYCDVAQACVLGDSGARRALVQLAAEGAESREPELVALSSLYDLATLKRAEKKR